NAEALKLTGSIALKGFMPDALDLRLVATNFEFLEKNLSGALQEQVEFVLNTATPNGTPSAITVAGPWQSPLVAGDVAISRGKVDLTRMGALTPGETKPFPVNPRFNLRVTTPGGIDVMPARTRVLAMVDATVGGSLNAPRVEGTVTSNSGSVSLPTAHFRLKEAEIAFRLSPPEPFAATGTALLSTNIRGSAASRKGTENYAVTAEVKVDFPAEKPVAIELTADPALQEQDIYRLLTRQDVLARLVGGQDANQDVAIEAILKEEVVNFMATALQPRLFEPVERAIADRLGLTEFSITASFDQPVEIKMGKRLVKGLRVSYTRSVSARDAKFRFRVEYEIWDNVSASWSTDERRSQVLGLEAGIRF
ncbi:MAG: translocation/assembly module TamB domain-containing protein, partial [Armatimonadota bacterium]|nr:translocation/assembly module TamB domain-containing protein [Armatimonadota bacterium]